MGYTHTGEDLKSPGLEVKTFVSSGDGYKMEEEHQTEKNDVKVTML